MDALVGFASLYARRGSYQHALQLLYFTLNHPSTIQETKARAERLFSEVSNQLSTQEIESARKCSEEKSLESVIDEIFQGSEKPAK